RSPRPARHGRPREHGGTDEGHARRQSGSHRAAPAVRAAAQHLKAARSDPRAGHGIPAAQARALGPSQQDRQSRFQIQHRRGNCVSSLSRGASSHRQALEGGEDQRVQHDDGN
ncbi:unnamed protein product, partial [Prorocentrum cordatum]